METSVLLFVIAALTAVVIILLLALLRQDQKRSVQPAETQENIDKYLLIDPKTGVYNQQFLHRKLEEEIYRAARYNTHFSVALFDFENILKNLDQQKAFTVFRKLVATASRDTRYSDFVARFEPYGIAVIFTMTSKASCEIPLNRLFSKFESVLKEDGLQGEPAVEIYGFPEDKTAIEKTILRFKG